MSIIVGKRYETIKQIGSGGFGTVYLALDKYTKRNVALKILNQNNMNSDALKRFESEITSLICLKHENITEILDYKISEKVSYIVQEFVNGDNLETIIKKRALLTQEEAVDYTLQLLNVLEMMHQHKFLHRDLKPTNIMITNSGKVKLCDLGLAKKNDIHLDITKSTGIVGTIYYMPPEVSRKYITTVESEIYVVGIMLYEMISGSKPFTEDNSGEDEFQQRAKIFKKHELMPLPSIRHTIKNVPQSLENVLIKATAKLPKQRYRSFQEMHDDLSTVFTKSRQFESKIEVINKFAPSFDLQKLQDENLLTNKISLPKQSLAIITIIFIILLGVFIRYVG